MASGKGCLGTLVSLIFTAVIIFAVIYFLFPDLSERYFSMSWSGGTSQGSPISNDQLNEAADELISEMSQALKDSGASKEDVQRVISQLDAETLKDAASEALRSGKNSVETFVDRLDKQIDFGSIDTSVVKDQLIKSASEIDFQAAFSTIQSSLENGLESLADSLKKALDKL